MERELKLTLGKLFGEIYRIQKKQEISQKSDAQIFGLLNGIEEAIETELESLNFISSEQVSVVRDALDPYYRQEKSLDDMPSFLNFRMGLERKGVSHSELLDILKYLKASGSYTTEIDKLGNHNLSDYDV